MAGHPDLPAACGQLPDDFPLERLAVDAPLAGDHEGRPAHELVEAQQVEHERRTVLQVRSVPAPEATGKTTGGARHGLSARIAVERRGQFVEALLQALDHGRIGALLRAEHARGLLEGHAHVAQHVELDRHAGVLQRLQRSGPAVGGGRAADGHDHPLSSRLDRRGDQLARAPRGRRPGVAIALGNEAQPAGLRRLHDRPAVLEQGEGGIDRATERVARLDSPHLAAEAGDDGVHCPLPAVGHGHLLGLTPCGTQPRRDCGGHLARREGSLEGVRRNQRRQLSQRPRGKPVPPRHRARRTRPARARRCARERRRP